MTRVLHDGTHKSSVGDISDHLQNHIHLTNCIHLRNYMHWRTYAKGDTPMMRDLVVLQRSKSLRDPSMSPSLWNSPSVLDFLSCPAENAALDHEERRSISIEQPMSTRRLRESWQVVELTPTCKVPPLGATSNVNTNPSCRGTLESSSTRNVKSYLGDCRAHHLSVEGEGELCSPDKRYGKDKLKKHEHSLGIEGKNASRVSVSENLKFRVKRHGKNKVRKDEESSIRAADGKALADTIKRRPCPSTVKSGEVKGNRHGKQKNQKLRVCRKNRVTTASLIGDHNELSIAENYLVRGAMCHSHAVENIHRDNRNACGIPLNWSKIHHRGKSILDLAGKSFSCGLGDSRLKNGGSASQARDAIPMSTQSDRSSSSSKHEGDALPLLVEASGSHRSVGSDSWARDYSKELEVCKEHLLNHNFSSSIASESSSGGRFKFKRHQIFTKKYMPRTFKDLSGQALVAQALSNLVSRRKIGLLYVFYGPHGTGKTSCARIFARALNCQSTEYKKPCNVCHHCIGKKSHATWEFGPGSLDPRNIMDILDNMIVSLVPSQYGVLIFDDCDGMPADNWNVISKVLDRAPKPVVFIFITASIDMLPHIITSKCQKFFFPKLKAADIICSLQKIVIKENLDIDKAALKLIASRSDGSLRDAEMTLEQLSLLGRRITVPLVQQLVGIISDNILIDLLDLALSSDMVNTVKNLRGIIESGVDPIDLMSQLATIITDILAGTYDFTNEGHCRRFFCRPELSKDDAERLGRALTALSDAEKQLRMSNDKSAWLTAALLQLVPDQRNRIPSSSMESISENNGTKKSVTRNRTKCDYNTNNQKGESSTTARSLQKSKIRDKDLNRIWIEVLEKIEVDNVKEFMYREGRLTSVTIGSAAKVQLVFGSPLRKHKAEKLKRHVQPAFEFVLGLPILFELISEPHKDRNIVSTSRIPESEIMEITDSPGHNGQRISLAHAMQQPGKQYPQSKAISIAEKLQQENMKLESKSRGFLCWKTSKASPRKLSRMRRARRSRSILKAFACGKSLPM